MISEDTVRQVRDNSRIAEVIGSRVKLERRGRSLVGLCPFHQEKSPSFHVNEERGFYFCFGCQASGDSIKFLQETEGMNFAEAVGELASRLGIEVVETRSLQQRQEQSAVRRKTEELFAINEAAAVFFEHCLASHPLASFAVEELERRALSLTGPEQMRTTLKAFRLGYAPYAWGELTEHLRQQRLSISAAEKLGLIASRRSGDGHYDRFRHRLMFAVTDLRGKVIAFSGRALPEPPRQVLIQLARQPLMNDAKGEAPAKYINSPETPVYKKREAVFGLYQARNTIRETDRCILVEGNFDVVSLHARGVGEAVAPLGTAFTPEQAKDIKRFTANVTLLFDGDKAGRRASMKAREASRKEALNTRVASLPDGVDPDDLVRSKGPDAIRASVRNARSMLEYLIETALDSGFNADDPQTQSAKIAEVVELIKSEDDPTVRALAQSHADRIASRLGISDVRSFVALSRAVRAASNTVSSGASEGDAAGRTKPAAPEHARSQSSPMAIAEQVVGALVEYPELRTHNEVYPLLVHLSGGLAMAVARIAAYGDSLQTNLELLPETFQQGAARRLAAPELADQDDALDVLKRNLSKLRTLESRRQNKLAVSEVRKAAATGDVEAEEEWLRRAVEAAQARREQ